MRPIKRLNYICLLSGLLLLTAHDSGAAEYDYPVSDAFVATVVGTPTSYRPVPAEKVRVKQYKLEVFKDQEVPDPLWTQKKLKFSLAYQKHSAPMIFVIAGTGASYQSSKMKFLQNVFYKEGYHVICISSPTHPNFIVSASSSKLPGNVAQDAEDIYRVMELCMEKVKNKVEVTDYYLTGYSLGGTQAAFVSVLDEEKKIFNFKKVLMLNPSVNLINSVTTIDDMLANNIPGGLDNYAAFFDDMMSKVSDEYGKKGYLHFDEDFLYNVYEEHDGQANEGNVKALIGTSFRISSGAMIYVADAMSNGGLIIPPNHVLTRYESTTDFSKVCGRTTFTDYFNDLFFPHFKKLDPSLTQEQMVENASLTGIKDYLKNTEKIGVMTNADDFILTADEVEFLKQTLAGRSVVYPTGGHCGNIASKAYVEYMINFLK
ncbi:hypothetical protein SCARR_04712 [Pontiella sulfatireligans]|uniref:AB hydrolase-1 domain-containing protein n=2 Tax=Pontiella sulfatireligans TaxID=2750658 RepID=A0A6C2UTT5_9BACT|nr:hypothetical protein SCARR_04712 [Pontiella sulfatireligans]